MVYRCESCGFDDFQYENPALYCENCYAVQVRGVMERDERLSKMEAVVDEARQVVSWLPPGGQDVLSGGDFAVLRRALERLDEDD